jgi:hypothetical protein
LIVSPPDRTKEKQFELTPEEAEEFLAQCFADYLKENNIQLYRIQDYFKSDDMFETCCMLTLMFRGKGFKFDHAITYIDDFIYNSTRAGGEPIDSQKIARAITQSILDV